MVETLDPVRIEYGWLTTSRMLAYQFLVGLPKSNTVAPIVLPTAYLWIIDTLALNRGTWVIEKGTKLGLQIWKGLEIEYSYTASMNTLDRAD